MFVQLLLYFSTELLPGRMYVCMGDGNNKEVILILFYCIMQHFYVAVMS